jgi:diguanylate cyclase
MHAAQPRWHLNSWAAQPQDGSLAMPGDSRQASHSRHEILRDMRAHGISLTTENYAVWHEYYESGDVRLRRAIDILISNNRVPDERAMHRLYTKYCAPVRETLALRDIAQRALETLQQVTGMLGDMQGAATDYGETLRSAEAGMAASRRAHPGENNHLKPLLDRLAGETRDMIRHSKSLVRRLNHSAERIQELEQFLSEARREAATDPLTGLANRRAFDGALREQAALAMNTGNPLSVLIADVDNFKTVNDRHGHDAGDEALRMVANCLTQAVRGRDIVARHGGEEFSVLLPNTAIDGAQAVAENIRAAISHSQLTLEATNTALTVTVSVGATTYEAGEKLSETLARADRALYRAKQEGRNRTAIAGPKAHHAKHRLALSKN